MLDFQAITNRDAWSTIRGYVYQVDLTIQRWLDLQQGQILQLEYGEDIDIISHSLIAPCQETERILEQIKHRETSITLKTPEVLSAIANFVEHRHNNPNFNLIFRFTTNTKIGKEQLTPIPNQMPGIQVWQQIYQNNIDINLNSNQEKYLEAIREILRNTKDKKPDKISKLTWTIFHEFLENSSNQYFFEFIQNFEFSVNQTEAKSLALDIQTDLINTSQATNKIEAKEKYQRLFLYIFKILSQSGLKQISREDLDKQLSLPTLSQEDHQKLENLNILFANIENRVTTLEQDNESTKQMLTGVSLTIQKIAEHQNIDISNINYSIQPIRISIPQKVTNRCSREKTVNSLVNNQILNYTWTAIHGSSGTGKTQLTILLLEKLISSESFKFSAWIRFRNLTVEEACIKLGNICQQLTGFRSSDINYLTFCQNLGHKSIIVLDDLPQLSRGDELFERLSELVDACYQTQIKLISNSLYYLPTSLTSNDELIKQIQIPLFSDNEASEIFKIYHCPDVILNSQTTIFVNSLANGHPTLLIVLAAYLKQRNWSFSDETFDDLLRGTYTDEVNDETIKRIISTVESDDSQELLYRLNLIISHFSEDDINSLASVEPTIKRPRHHLVNLLGIWIQRDTQNRYLISPLVQALGSNNLDKQVYKNCNCILGESLMQRCCNQYDTSKIILYFVRAEDFERAGTILLISLKYFLEQNIYQIINDAGILSYWIDIPLPNQMSLGLQLCIRAFQISVKYRLGKTTEYEVKDLDDLIKQTSIDDAPFLAITTVTLIIYCLDLIEFKRINYYLQCTLLFLPQATLPDDPKVECMSESNFEDLIWMIAIKIETIEDLYDWMITVSHLTHKQRNQAFSIEIAEHSCLYIANDFYLREKEKSRDVQQWDLLFVGLQKIVDKSKQLHLELLWACFICHQIIVKAQHLQDLDSALEIAKNTLNESSDDYRVHFLIKLYLGEQYKLANQYDKALRWLNEALNESTSSYSRQRMYALLYKSNIYSLNEPYLAIQYAVQAVKLGENSEKISEIELIKALGELSIARWIANKNDLSYVFDSWDKAGERLFNCKTDKNDWKEIFVIYAHVSGYFLNLAINNVPPPHTLDGQPYAEPEAGMFLTYNSQRVEYYDPTKESILLTQLAMFAQAIGEEERKKIWMLKGWEIAKATKQVLSLSILPTMLIPEFLLEDKYVEALDLALETSQQMVALIQHHQEENVFEQKLDIEKVLSSFSDNTKDNENSIAIYMGLIPVLFHLNNIAIHQPDKARKYTEEIVKLCYIINQNAEGREVWEKVAKLIERMVLQKQSFEEIIKHDNQYNEPTLKFIGYLLVLLNSNSTLESILKIHFIVMPLAHHSYKSSPAIYNRIILPYLVDYWKNAIQKVTFRFTSPQDMANLLYNIQDIPEGKQAQLILFAIISDLSIIPPDSTVKWIAQAKL